MNVTRAKSSTSDAPVDTRRRACAAPARPPGRARPRARARPSAPSRLEYAAGGRKPRSSIAGRLAALVRASPIPLRSSQRFCHAPGPAVRGVRNATTPTTPVTGLRCRGSATRRSWAVKCLPTLSGSARDGHRSHTRRDPRDAFDLKFRRAPHPSGPPRERGGGPARPRRLRRGAASCPPTSSRTCAWPSPRRARTSCATRTTTASPARWSRRSARTATRSSVIVSDQGRGHRPEPGHVPVPASACR